MKFTKGLIIGGLITTGLIMMYNDTNMMNKNKMMKKGKQFAKKIGIMYQKSCQKGRPFLTTFKILIIKQY